jgi:hypothetical protein
MILLLFFFRLSKEQRSAIADYFHVYKVMPHTQTVIFSYHGNLIFLFFAILTSEVKIL